jgi:hypothetical protein
LLIVHVLVVAALFAAPEYRLPVIDARRVEVTSDEFGMAPFVTVTVPPSITLVA